MKMQLYHYATRPYRNLLVSRNTVVRSEEDIERIVKEEKRQGLKNSYLDHISFFIDPLPRDLGSLYQEINHKFWRKGQVLYEHIVETQRLCFAFELVETPFSLEFARNHWRDDFVEEGNRKQYDAYFREHAKALQREGLLVNMGFNNGRLENAVQPFIGKTRQAYIDALANDDPVVLANYYAPSVPHVLLYPAKDSLSVLTEPTKFTLA